jgi:tetratricopeptide (TPR) repeat protein
MTEERPQRVRALFDQAADLPPADQKGFLDASCPDEPDLRARVEHLLACDARLRAQEGVRGVLDSPLVRSPPKATDPGEDTPATLVTPRPPLPSVPGYTLVRELGRGGMGVVYLAQQLRLNRSVAVKMPPVGLGDEEWLRFRTEAEAAARLQHPHIVQVHETGEHQGRPYLVMELVEGGSLAQKLAQAPLAARPAAELLETLARAIHYAHERGVIHRDLKPANVLLTADGTPKVSDFGLAKRLTEPLSREGEPPGPRTQTGAILGTPSYMAPEQAAGRGKEAGPATDVYALGAVLYECLTGRPPFRGATALETTEQVLHDDPVSLRKLQPGVPRDLETVCLKCLAKEPPRRYASAALLADDLRRQLDGKPVTARPVSRAERVWRWARRKPRDATLVVFGLLALLLAGGVWLWQVRSQEERDRQALEAQQERDRQAMEALSQAISLHRQARKEDDPAKWPAMWTRARELAQHAEKLLEQGSGHPELAVPVRALLQELRGDDIDRWGRDRAAQTELARDHASRREWNKAAACYDRVLNLAPTEAGHFWFEYAAVLLLSGDREGYRKACARMLQHCGETPQLRAYHVARACTLAPGSVADPAALGRLADKELREENPEEFWSLTERAALLYRAGKFQEAVPLLEKSLEAEPKQGRAVLNWLWLALAKQRLGQAEEARRWLDRAANWLDQYKDGLAAYPEEPLGFHLHNWLEAHVLRREAEALLGR